MHRRSSSSITSSSSSSSYTFGSFLRQLSRSTPQEAKLLMLRNIELFHVRPDMFTKCVANIPWQNALSLMDSAFYTLKDIELKSYQVALSKLALAQAKENYERDISSGVLRRSEEEEMIRMMANNNNIKNKRSSSSTIMSSANNTSSSAWISSLKLLSRLVQAEGNQTPPSAYSLAAQCLSPSRQWQQAIECLLKTANDRDVLSKSLLLNVAECCTTSSSWSYGLKCLALSKPDFLTTQNPALSLASSSSSSSDPKQHDELLLLKESEEGGSSKENNNNNKDQEANFEQNSRVLTKLLIASPWQRALSILTSKKARNSGITSAVLDDERNVTKLLEAWLLRSGGRSLLLKKNKNKNNSNLVGAVNAPPPEIISQLAMKSACFADANNSTTAALFGSPASSTSTNESSSSTPNKIVENDENTSSSLIDMSADCSTSQQNQQHNNSSNHRQIPPAQIRLLVSIAIKSRDLQTLAQLLNQVGNCSIVGKTSASTAITLLLLDDNTNINNHDVAIQIAQRCLAENVTPLSPICLKAIVASYHKKYFTELMSSTNSSPISASSFSSCWFEALGLLGGLSHNKKVQHNNNINSINSNDVLRNSLNSATREEQQTSSSYQNTSQFLDDARTLTKLIQICSVVSNAPEPALRLIGQAKNSNAHQHHRGGEVRLEHEKIVSAMLFCQQHGRWREAMTVFGKFYKEQQQQQQKQQNENRETERNTTITTTDKKKKKMEGVVKVLYQILQVILTNEGKEEMMMNVFVSND